MGRNRAWLVGLGRICLPGLIVSTASAQQQTTSSEVKNFEVVSVDGNKVVVKGEQGAQEITVPEDFRVTVDGKSVSVRELRPGMKGSATITTTTTVTPVYVTEVRNAEVVQASASSIIVRGQNGFQMYTEGDVERRGIKIFKNGRPVSFSDLHTRDKLTATIVTEGPPKVVTEREVQARMSSPPPPPAQAAPHARDGSPAESRDRTRSSSQTVQSAAATELCGSCRNRASYRTCASCRTSASCQSPGREPAAATRSAPGSRCDAAGQRSGLCAVECKSDHFGRSGWEQLVGTRWGHCSGGTRADSDHDRHAALRLVALKTCIDGNCTR